MSDQAVDRVLDEIAATCRQIGKLFRAVGEIGFSQAITNAAEEVAAASQKPDRCAGDGAAPCALAPGHDGPHKSVAKVVAVAT